jgi:gamma-glutamylcyclotransferase (GGCT)/AIG2-like uncharacterized protein YtfP
MIRRFVIALVGCSLLLALYAEVQRQDEAVLQQLDQLRDYQAGGVRS